MGNSWRTVWGTVGHGAAVVLAMASHVTMAQPAELAQHGDEAVVEILDGGKARPCSAKAGLCAFAVSSSTVAVESAQLAVAASRSPMIPMPSRFARVTSAAAGQTPHAVDAASPWAIELAGTLKRPAWGGNAVFLLFDADDAEAMAAQEVTALYQSPLHAGKSLALRLTLSPEDGFRAGHTYLLRVVQIIAGKEITLAESSFTLL